MYEIFILMSDLDGTTRSISEPMGIAVTTIEEAERFVLEAKERNWNSCTYNKIKVFTNKDDALNWRFPNIKKHD